MPLLLPDKYYQDATICFRKVESYMEPPALLRRFDVAFSSESAKPQRSFDAFRGCVAIPVQLDNPLVKSMMSLGHCNQTIFFWMENALVKKHNKHSPSPDDCSGLPYRTSPSPAAATWAGQVWAYVAARGAVSNSVSFSPVVLVLLMEEGRRS